MLESLTALGFSLFEQSLTLPSSLAEASTILDRKDERLDHFSLYEVAIELCSAKIPSRENPYPVDRLGFDAGIHNTASKQMPGWSRAAEDPNLPQPRVIPSLAHLHPRAWLTALQQD